MNNLAPMGALVKRELIRSLRRPRSLGLAAFVVAAASVVALLIYPEGDLLPFELREASQQMFAAVTGVLFAAAVLLLPPVASSSLVLEREQDTYELLWLTLLGPWGIALTKALNAVGYYLLMACAVLPVMCASAFLIGIDVSLVVFAFLTVIASAISAASIGVLCSASSRSTTGAVVTSYGIVFFLFVGYMLPVRILSMMLQGPFGMGVGWPLARAMDALFYVSPVWALGTIIANPASVSQNFVVPIIALAAQTAIALGATAYAARILSRPIERRTYLNPVGLGSSSVQARPLRYANGPPPLPGAPQKETLQRELRYRPSPQVVDIEYLYETPLPSWPPVRDDVNPMFARELIQLRLNARMTGPRAAVLFLVGAAIFCTALITSAGWLSSGAARLLTYTWINLELFGAVVIAPVAASACWAREREGETFDVLRMTLLTPWQVVQGKTLASIRASFQFAVLLFAVSCPAALSLYGGPEPLLLFFVGLITVAVTLFECVALCVFVGLSSHRTPAALVAGITWLSLLYGVPLLGSLVMLSNKTADFWTYAAALLSPAVAFNMIPQMFYTTTVGLTAVTWVLSCALHALAGYALLRWTAARYERLYARAA